MLLGGEMQLLYLAWKHGKMCPYRLFNMLDDRFSPWESGGRPLRPPFPRRLRNVLYAFASLAEAEMMAAQRQQAATAGMA